LMNRYFTISHWCKINWKIILGALGYYLAPVVILPPAVRYPL
jgi:hypothetical protein